MNTSNVSNQQKNNSNSGSQKNNKTNDVNLKGNNNNDNSSTFNFSDFQFFDDSKNKPNTNSGSKLIN